MQLLSGNRKDQTDVIQAVSECTVELTSHRLVAKEENLILALHRVIRAEKEEVKLKLVITCNLSPFAGRFHEKRQDHSACISPAWGCPSQA